MQASGLKRFTVALVLSACAGAAWSQYVWLNEKGVKQYSDTAPPASVPNSKILKTPKGSTVASAPAQPVQQIDKDGDTAKKAPQTLAEKNADFQKRKAEQAEKDKEAEAKAKQAADKKLNCERANNYKRVLDSGERISRMDKSGERAYMSDEERAHESRENKRALEECK
jgi:hypothetical protein